MNTVSQIPIIILAAGESKRLGRAKQLLEYKGETLLNRTIRMANEVSRDIIVVLGARLEEISQSISNKNVQIVLNENWETGMASSVIAGLRTRLKAEKVILSLCDQPYLTPTIFENLIAVEESSQKSIIASNYGNEIGVPMLFNQLIYNDLLALKGDKGARAILQKYEGSIAAIDFPDGDIDIDTIEEWELFLKE
ncbi:MAG: nucleotidyltransferase family protein [Bacteroidota bacterium]